MSYLYIRISSDLMVSQDTLQVEITQKRKPKIVSNDNVILLFKRSFVGYGIITKVPDDKSETILETLSFQYEIGEIKAIESPNDLDGYAYSLQKVYKHYDKPYKHFSRSYGRISSYEFQIIINHDYFISRTAFGRIINNLPLEHKKAFMAFVSERGSNTVFNEKKDYVTLFEFLKDYIDNNILLQIDMLKEANSILIDDLHISERIGFMDASSEVGTIQYIESQIDYITDSEKELESEASLGFILQGIKEFQDEEKKKNLKFKDKCLPVNF